MRSEGQSVASSLLGGEEGGGESQLLMTGCEAASCYSAVRFEYAFVHDESWCEDLQQSGCAQVVNYGISWAREFRYDGARARYMNRPLDVSTLGGNPQPHATLPTIWTDYDGHETYGDFTATGNPLTVTNTDKHEPGLWRRSAAGTVDYLHNDHLGTLRRTSNASGAHTITARLFTAFGEKLSTATDRFGYVGASGYQTQLGVADFEFLHVGHRYYDPGSGRFLQRDPVGIAGGTNVFLYVDGSPTDFVDEDGLAKKNNRHTYRDSKTGRYKQLPWWRKLSKKLGKWILPWPIGKKLGKEGAELIWGEEYDDPEDILMDIFDDLWQYERNRIKDRWKKWRNPPSFPPSWRGRENYRGGTTC